MRPLERLAKRERFFKKKADEARKKKMQSPKIIKGSRSQDKTENTVDKEREKYLHKLLVESISKKPETQDNEKILSQPNTTQQDNSYNLDNDLL